MKFNEKKQNVIEALDELFADTSVSQETTLEALEEIEGEIEGKIDALESDIKAKMK